MKIYFACSITGGREFEGVYQSIVGALGREGHQVPNGHLAESGIGAREAVLSPREVYARDVAWILEADVLIAEVSVPSHGVGYEVGFALENRKPTLALYQEGRKVSKMITGNPHALLQVRFYHEADEAVQIIRQFLANL
jgi:nucleoside 2-deoxyribosyltransferase